MAKPIRRRIVEQLWQGELKQDKVCKHSIRYSLVMPDEQTFSVYVPKSILPKDVPTSITLTVAR